jgi:hypothetical protein
MEELMKAEANLIENYKFSLSRFSVNQNLSAKKITIALLAAALILIYSISVLSLPDGISVNVLGNTTKTVGAGTKVNLTGNSTTAPNAAGGYIFTINVTGETQNTKWKAFVGNASGKLTLDDALGNTIYDWTLTSTAGRIFATRGSTSVNWSGIGCATLNVTEHENRFMNQTSKDDNITKTFNAFTGKTITIGTTTIAAGQCRMTNIFLNSSSPNPEDTFEENVLYDLNGTAYTVNDNFRGNIVYGQSLESQRRGYTNASTYDFQLLLPERGEPSWAGATAYYFYVELA